MQEFNFKINGHDYNVVINDISGNTATVTVNGTSYTIDIPSDDSWLQKLCPTPVSAGSPQTAYHKSVVSPLPGVIIGIKVGRGQAVRRGDKIAVLEAMKMENDILAPIDGTVKDIFVSKGDAVLEGAKIAEIE